MSSDSEAIRTLSVQAGVPPLPPRSSELSADSATSHAVVVSILQDELAKGSGLPEAIFLLQPTSPFRASTHIRSAIEAFSSRSDADSLVSCQVVPHQWLPSYQAVVGHGGFLVSPTNGSLSYPSKQAEQTHLVRNGAIYGTRVPQIFEYLLGGRVLPYLMDDFSSIDINTELDLSVADLLATSVLNHGCTGLE